MHNIDRFYKHRKKSILYLTNHCLDSQLDEIEDLYHEALIIADRRKNTDSSRDDGLCLFSGYSTALRSGSHSDWHYKHEFIDYSKAEFLLNEGDIYSPKDPFSKLLLKDRISLLAQCFSLSYIYCSQLRASIQILLCFFFGDYDNMTRIGEDYDLSRERVRQLRNLGLSSSLEIMEELKSLEGFQMFFLYPITFFEYSKNLNKIPNHLSFLSLYDYFNQDFVLAFYKYLKVMSFFFKNKREEFNFIDHTHYKGKQMIESKLVSKDIFFCLPPSPLNIYYHHDVQVIEIGWLRELFARFVRDDGGWYDEVKEEELDERVYYQTVPDLIEDIIMDYISENFEFEEYELMKSELEDKFLKFFE